MTALAFNSHQLEPVNHNNSIWLTSAQIAQALEYSDTRAVTKIFNRNIDEFTAGMTEVLNLTTSGNLQKEVRIFSLRGAHLIAMFARTSVAKAFRKWVLDILDNEVKQDHAPSLAGRRWLVYFDHNGVERTKEVPRGACVMTIEKFMQGITNCDVTVETMELFAFHQAIGEQLAKRFAYQKHCLDKLK